jgi:TolB-like protein/DNA-binding winged helix-turn-helix (wHTH) protein/Tfp pilus assembly protein PilF
VPACTYQFGEFELDPSRFELRRSGRVLKLERIPMDLLILLAEKQGDVATRQEIIERLWGKDVFVDTEHGINTAIRKIRQVLRDDPEHPRFVQTVTGKGYRFIAEKAEDRAEDRKVAASGPEIAERRDSETPSGVKPATAAVPEISGSFSSQISPESPVVSRSRQRILTLAALVLLLCAAGLFSVNAFGVRDRVFALNRATQIHSIAVIPLANLTGDSSQEYFADGMTDELITALAKNHSLRVVSRTSAMQYKGVQRPVRDIARELGVDGILEGSVSRAANRVHMTVQLIYAPTDSHVWAESYDRDLNQAYSLPEELSQTIAKEVKVATSPAAPSRYVSPEAHDAYLHGRYFWFTFNVANTLPYFEKAIQLQPDYAAAWSGLADTYAIDGMQNRPTSEVNEKCHFAALKAIELDPSLPEAHNSLAAWYLFYGWDPTRAEVEARRALELNPNYGEGHHVLSYILEVQQRYPQAEVEARRSAELDPFAHVWELGVFYTNIHQYEAALKELTMQRLARPDDPDIALNLGILYWLKGMYKESQSEYERGLDLQHDVATKAAAHQAWITGGEPAVERWGVKNIKTLARKQYFETEFIASIIAFSGDKDETMKYLEASYRMHDPDLIFIQNQPLFDFLHSDPRYQSLVKKMGLPPAY